MSIAEKLAAIAKNVSRVFYAGYDKGQIDGFDAGDATGYQRGYFEGNEIGIEQGKQAEHNRFWGLYQDYGNRTDQNAAYARSGWTDETFQPEYDILFVGQAGNGTFSYCKITNLKQILNNRKIAFNTTECTYHQQMFQGSTITNIPTIDIRKSAYVGYMFQGCQKLVEVEKLVVAKTTPVTTNMFSGAFALVSIDVEGEIGASMNFKDCPLNRASLTSVATALAPDVTATLTVKKTAVDAAFPNRAEWDALFADKPNWTITEV